MQGQSRRILLVLLFGLLAALLILSGRTIGAFQKGLPQSEKALRYPYQQLSVREQKLYTALCSGIAEQKDLVKLPGVYRGDEYKRVYLLVAEQEPQFFYLDTVYETGDLMSDAEMFYRRDVTDIDMMTAEMEFAADRILADAAYASDDIGKLLAIHDGIAENCEYEEDAFSSEAYGCLVRGKAKCEGYAKAFLYVARRAGLHVMNVTGTDSRGENHVWNIAEADGTYYQIDVTWDDDRRYGGRTVHACFCQPDERFSDHAPDLTAFLPPDCTADDDGYDYYKMKDTYITHASELPDKIMAWTGSPFMMEFRFADADVMREAKSLIRDTTAVGEAVRIASGAAVYQALADEARNVLVILPS